MDGSECLIFQGDRAGSARDEESEVKLGMALIHRLGFEACEQPEDGAGAGGIFALEAFESFSKALEAFLHFHWVSAERAVFNFGDADARFHRLVQKFVFLKAHDEADDPWRFDGAGRIGKFGPGGEMTKGLPQGPVTQLLAGAAAIRSGEAIGFVEAIVDGGEVEDAAIGN
jgi:hypothetical protein